MVLALLLCAHPKHAIADEFTKELSAGEEFTHTIVYDNQDTYTINSPKDGYAYFEVTVLDGDYNPLTFSGGVTVYGDITSDYTSYNGGIEVSLDEGTVQTGYIALPPGQSINFDITAAYSAQVTYTVKAIVVNEQSFESEPNDTKEQADAIQPNVAIRGLSNASQRYSDNDCYEYTATSPGYVNACVRIIDGDQVDYSAYLDGNEAQEDTAKDGDGWVSSDKVYIEKGQHYYLDVTCDSPEVPPLYEAMISFTPVKTHANTASAPKAVALKSVKGKKGSLVVKWAKGKGIDGYRVRYSTDKNFPKNATKTKSVSASKNKLTIKKLKAGKRYYVQVRTYKKQASSPYSSWSRILSAKAK